MSEPFDSNDVERWVHGKRLGEPNEKPFIGVSIDTRTLMPGELFIAVRGELHDAHGFLDRALAEGATGLVVESGRADLALAAKVPLFEVESGQRALANLAAGHRSRFAGPLVAVTGSNGKTTTKEMIHAVLSARGPSLKNQGNLNNEFGLPLTLLRREAEHWAAVVEIGMNHRGEIEPLAAVAKPTVAVITNVGTAHIEHLGSREEIANEKGDLLPALGSDGIAVLNADDALVMTQRERAPGRVITFGIKSDANVAARDIRFLDEGAFAFALELPDVTLDARISGLSDTTIINALAAAAAGLAAGLSPEEIGAGLADFKGVAGRMAPRSGPAGTRILDDTYNANPQSVRAALESLARLKGDGRGIAVLGDMGELGSQSDDLHRQTGHCVHDTGTDVLITLGERAKAIADAARDAGLAPACVVHCETRRDAAQAARDLARKGDWILVKGSRAMRMEEVVAELMPEDER